MSRASLSINLSALESAAANESSRWRNLLLCFCTWHFVLSSSVLVIPSVAKWLATHNGADGLANSLDLYNAVIFNGFLNMVLLAVKSQDFPELRWFFERDCRKHIRKSLKAAVRISRFVIKTIISTISLHFWPRPTGYLLSPPTYGFDNPDEHDDQLLRSRRFRMRPVRVQRRTSSEMRGKDVPVASVNLPREAFLEDVILASLNRVNAQTTIVPTFSGIKDVDVDAHGHAQARRWVLQFATWGEHPNKVDAECNWREVTKHAHANAGHLEFEWKNKDLWRYEHEDDQYTSGMYSVDCITHNVLTIPTSYSGKTLIQLKGVVRMHLKYEGVGPDWSSEASVNWTASISLTSTSTGLQVSMHPARVIPEIRSAPLAQGTPGHDTHAQTIAELRSKFPEVIDFSGLIADMQSELDGAWTSRQVQGYELRPTKPVFNNRGDFMFDLIAREPHFTGAARHHLNGKASFVKVINGNDVGHDLMHASDQVALEAGGAIGSNAHSPSLSRIERRVD